MENNLAEMNCLWSQLQYSKTDFAVGAVLACRLSETRGDGNSLISFSKFLSKKHCE